MQSSNAFLYVVIKHLVHCNYSTTQENVHWGRCVLFSRCGLAPGIVADACEINTMTPEQDDCYFAVNIFKYILMEITLFDSNLMKFVPKGPTSNTP